MMINSLMSNMALEAEVVFLTQLNSTFFSQLQKQPIPTVNFVEQNQNHFLLNFVKAPQLEVQVDQRLCQNGSSDYIASRSPVVKWLLDGTVDL